MGDDLPVCMLTPLGAAELLRSPILRDISARFDHPHRHFEAPAEVTHRNDTHLFHNVTGGIRTHMSRDHSPVLWPIELQSPSMPLP